MRVEGRERRERDRVERREKRGRDREEGDRMRGETWGVRGGERRGREKETVREEGETMRRGERSQEKVWERQSERREKIVR